MVKQASHNTMLYVGLHWQACSTTDIFNTDLLYPSAVFLIYVILQSVIILLIKENKCVYILNIWALANISLTYVMHFTYVSSHIT